MKSFGERLRTFIPPLNESKLDAESLEINRKLLVEFFQNPSSVYRESYILYVMARTCFDISREHLMPRLAGLSSMLIGRNDQEREELMTNLKKDLTEVQRKVKELIDQRKKLFQKAVKEKRAQIN